MNKQDIIQFLEKFELDNQTIDKFLENKQIIEKNKNIFLTDKPFDKNQVLDNGIIFIQLNKFLPTTYLLKFISENTPTIQVKSQKQAMNYTYGKNLSFDSTIKTTLVNSRCYIVKFEDMILGYAKIDKTQKHPIINEMNIGEYLKEN